MFLDEQEDLDEVVQDDRQDNVTIDFNQDDSTGDTEERPKYGGEHGRPYNVKEVVGLDEYVDGSSGRERIYHNDKEVNRVGSIKLDNPMEGPTNIKPGDREFVKNQSGTFRGAYFENMDGDRVDARIAGAPIILKELDISSLFYTGDEGTEIRKRSYDTTNLRDSIDAVGLLEPILVTPFGEPIGYEQDEDGNDIEELEIYAKYVVVNGRRRVGAMVDLGYDTIPVVIDATIPYELVQLYKSFSNSNEPYTFSEKLNYVSQIKHEQPNIDPDLLGTTLGFKVGELPKAEYIESMKIDYPDIYNKVDTDKLTVEQGFKSIQKEIDKKEKELEKEENGGLSGQDAEDALREKQGSSDLNELDIDVKKQELGDRHILDAAVRRHVESRDRAQCQACGYGEGIPDLTNIFSVHHMVPVQYGGSDSTDNLILLCQNCHKMAHDYEVGRIALTEQTYNQHDFIKKVVAIGNIMRKTRQKGILKLREEDPAMAKRMDKGAITIGRALQKSGVNLDAERTLFNGSPYQSFKDAIADVRFSGVKGDLGLLDGLESEEPDDPEDMTLEELMLDVEIDEQIQEELNLKKPTVDIEDMPIEIIPEEPPQEL